MEKINLGEGALIFIDSVFMPSAHAQEAFHELCKEVPWEQRPGLFGHLQPRLIAAQGNEGVTYRYSGLDYAASPWTPAAWNIKQLIEALMGRYNYCLLNRYRSGADSMGWHADDEPELGNTIASVSLGAVRKFRMRHNTTRETKSFLLESGTLLIMDGTTQKFWKHEVPKTKKPIGERINLTYRLVQTK